MAVANDVGFLQALASGGRVVLAGGATTGSRRQAGMPATGDEEGVSPGEDLRREHGVFERILLI